MLLTERCGTLGSAHRDLSHNGRSIIAARLLERARHGNAELISEGFETRHDGGVQFDPTSKLRLPARVRGIAGHAHGRNSRPRLAGTAGLRQPAASRLS